MHFKPRGEAADSPRPSAFIQTSKVLCDAWTCSMSHRGKDNKRNGDTTIFGLLMFSNWIFRLSLKMHHNPRRETAQGRAIPVPVLHCKSLDCPLGRRPSGADTETFLKICSPLSVETGTGKNSLIELLGYHREIFRHN